MKILVTGAEGFIGKNVKERMEGMNLSDGLSNTGWGDKIKIVGVDKEGAPDVYADLSADFNYQPELQIDGVIHLAAKAGVRTFASGDHDNNVNATRNLLRWMDACGVKFLIYASSSSVYGNAKIMDETTLPGPQSEYAYSKWECEKLVKKWCKDSGGVAVTFRIFNAIGKHQRKDMFPSLIADHMRDTSYNGELADPLVVFGNRLRSWTYVGDIVNAFWSAHDQFFLAKGGTCLTVNLGTANSMSQMQLINAMIEKSVVKQLSIEHGEPHPLDLQRTKADMTRFSSLFGWVPNPRNVDVGIEEILLQNGLLAPQ